MDFHQKWALEHIFCKILKLLTKIAVKFELLELKIVIFSNKKMFTFGGELTCHIFFQIRVL